MTKANLLNVLTGKGYQVTELKMIKGLYYFTANGNNYRVQLVNGDVKIFRLDEIKKEDTANNPKLDRDMNRAGYMSLVNTELPASKQEDYRDKTPQERVLEDMNRIIELLKAGANWKEQIASLYAPTMEQASKMMKGNKPLYEAKTRMDFYRRLNFLKDRKVLINLINNYPNGITTKDWEAELYIRKSHLEFHTEEMHYLDFQDKQLYLAVEKEDGTTEYLFAPIRNIVYMASQVLDMEEVNRMGKEYMADFNKYLVDARNTMIQNRIAKQQQAKNISW